MGSHQRKMVTVSEKQAQKEHVKGKREISLHLLQNIIILQPCCYDFWSTPRVHSVSLDSSLLQPEKKLLNNIKIVELQITVHVYSHSSWKNQIHF